MEERGGPATQAGIRYQNSVAALYLGDLLRWDCPNPAERVLEVRVEAPAHVDDVVLRYADGHREWIQVKLNLNPNGKAWDKLWIDFQRQRDDSRFGIDDQLVLVLGTASQLAQNLVDLADRARFNEVADLNAFSDELKAFLNAVCQYDMVKVIVTCRSEFFDGKYASMLDEQFAVNIHRVGDLRSKMTERSKNRLLKAYLDHFKIKGGFSKIAEDFLKSDLLLLRIFCERYEGIDIGYMTDIYKGDLFEQYLLKKITSFPQNLQAKALPTLYRIVTAMFDTDDFAKLSVRSFTAEEQEVVRRFVDDDVILRQEIGAEGLSALGDLVISFTYDELRDFVIAYKLVVGDANGDAGSLRAALATLPGRPIYEGVYRYAYLLARKANDAAAIAACESGPDFVEHFSLNVHLLPPAVQTRDDVERVKALLADSSAPERLRHAARFLVHRPDTTELLNITILRDHLNGLETADHAKFARAMFAHRYDYERYEWQQRLHGLIHDVAEDNAEEELAQYDPEWLAFFLHASSLADWSERERVSTMFREAMDASNCRDAVELVRPARTEAMRILLADIESVEDVGQ